MTLRTWTKVVGEKTKGQLYGLGNLVGNYHNAIATTLKFTLNVGEGSSRKPELTPEMRKRITKLTQEQLDAQMQSQKQLILEVVRRQQEFFNAQLPAFRQELGWPTDEQGVGKQGGSQPNVRASVCDDDVDPYEVYGDDDDVDVRLEEDD